MSPLATAAELGICLWPVAGPDQRSAWRPSLSKKTRMAVGAVGNGLPFSKGRWARPRVHGPGSVHGLFSVPHPWSAGVAIVASRACGAVELVTPRPGPRLGRWRSSPDVWRARS